MRFQTAFWHCVLHITKLILDSKMIEVKYELE
jgi:hypothetical protein